MLNDFLLFSSSFSLFFRLSQKPTHTLMSRVRVCVCACVCLHISKNIIPLQRYKVPSYEIAKCHHRCVLT